jgi:hypothetical protein
VTVTFLPKPPTAEMIAEGLTRERIMLFWIANAWKLKMSK